MQENDSVIPYAAQATSSPWYSVAEGHVYPSSGHPLGESDDAWFEVIGSFIYPTAQHYAGWTPNRPVYRLVRAFDDTPTRAA